MAQQLYQPGGGFPIPSQHDTGHRMYLYHPPTGPFAIVYDGDETLTVSSGRLWLNDNDDINFAGTSFSYGGGNLTISLKCTLSGGVVTDAYLSKDNFSNFKYRDWSGAERTAETQTSLNAIIAEISTKPANEESSSLVRGKKILRIFQCVNHDLMVYEACDGLILLPAPFAKL